MPNDLAICGAQKPAITKDKIIRITVRLFKNALKKPLILIEKSLLIEGLLLTFLPFDLTFLSNFLKS
jgi:hypothetical protein